MTAVQRLSAYYKRLKISATDCRCPSLANCKAGNKSFKKAREAYVGRCYEKGHPKLVFLSLDPGRDDTRWNMERSMAGLRNGAGKWPKKNHWKGTLEVAKALLERFIPELTIDKVHLYFAHTNSAKCCQNKSNGAEADNRLFKNCSKHIPGELERLAPDVIVTQGDKAKRVLMEFKEISNAIPGMRKTKRDKIRIVNIAGRNVLWIYLFHPNQKQDYFHKRDWPRIERYSDFVSSFVDDQRG